MESLALSSVMPFPNIQWWCHVLDRDKIIWDLGEYFEKMSTRNRYVIATANGRLKLNIPLKKGRDQRTKMEFLEISSTERWQQQHWRTLISAYNRSPYFEYYAPSLEHIFLRKFEKVYEFNLASVDWLSQQIGLIFENTFFYSFVKETPEMVPDLRFLSNKNSLAESMTFPKYYQVFEERIGFIPNLSVLDLLFSEGPHTLTFLRKHQQEIMAL